MHMSNTDILPLHKYKYKCVRDLIQHQADIEDTADPYRFMPPIPVFKKQKKLQLKEYVKVAMRRDAYVWAIGFILP